MKTLIKNGRVVDPASNRDGEFDLLIDGKTITAIEPRGKIAAAADYTIDAAGHIVAPGFIDVHVHLRDPGLTHKETLETGAKSAAAGGFSTICCMANTSPIIQTVESVNYIKSRSREIGLTDILPIAAVSKDQLGEMLNRMDDLAEAGAIAFSDDGSQRVLNPNLMKRAMDITCGLGKPIINHCEDPKIIGKGVMNAGVIATKLGLEGNSRDAEIEEIKRDLDIARQSRARFHVAHLTTKEGVELIRQAKNDGLSVTTEVTPHHLTLTEKEILRHPYDANFKVSPPLRREDDIETLRIGFNEGVIDCLATDHAPHSPDEKRVPFSMAPFGVIGLETALPIYMTLVNQGILTLSQVIAALTINPARLIGVDAGIIKSGSIANITIINPEKKHILDVKMGHSKSFNSPFDGWEVVGKVTDLLINGKHLLKNGELI